MTILLNHSDYSQFILNNKNEILSTLRRLKTKNAYISVFTEGNDSYISSILAITDTHIVLDDAKYSDLTRPDDDIILATQEDKIKVQFESNIKEKTIYSGYPAIICGIPERLLRLQRREYYRVHIPKKYHVTCTYKTQANDDEIIIQLSAVDISGGGLAADGFTDDLSGMIGCVIENCNINIPGTETINVNCQVCYYAENDIQGHIQKRAGLKFLNLKDRYIMQIQKLVMRIEQENKI